ncbi:precorrin-2 dehydrogenase/sirohydrochlorin ferrochelatase [Anoxybacillus vitaminiphilus]|uniref:precorrin-2 dehydrogenase n=1 Tax=Paranoxybacillus vitaminiphilus TaxID=581036 RepID=A0A327YFC6_9BACL|nr:NAD(P)-binding protein [Anoxybacillus vitaminiphilus]RAK19167.1 precorrin-2 dehydrogenase/sirohydrochlorin ferrochelatase [Anoxybacillus vitaminiphilus]
MKKNYYPIMLDLTGKHVVVIGGGKVAERKVKGLKETNAKITVVAPMVTPSLEQMAKQKEIQWIKKQFSLNDVKDAFLIVAATDKREINKMVLKAAKPHQLVNVADDPEKSNFHVPSVFRRGKLHIAVSTSGASPILTKKICSEIANMYDEQYEQYIDFLYECRQHILQNVSDHEKKQQLLQAITDESFRKRGNWEEEFSKLLKRVLGEL